MVTQCGIEANSKKIWALIEMQYPWAKKDVQWLTNCAATLSRFILKSAKKYHPFFKILEKINHFEWSEECRVAFDKLKHYLGSPLLLSKPMIGEDLYFCLSISPIIVSSVLVWEDVGSQNLIYNTSKLLQDVEVKYSKVEKMICTPVATAWWL